MKGNEAGRGMSADRPAAVQDRPKTMPKGGDEMLELLLGPSGSGKTWRLVDEIRRRAEEGRFSVMIVPEQFSSTAELTLYEKLGDQLCARTGVYSFRSLAEKIESVYGGGARKTVTDAGRVVLARRAAVHVGDRLTLYK
ncbi:MAG: hypothetical protein Q4G07_03485, partial [Oscillospiraceae bacterium]|nr:hypothetical protein [Oscillospiraceae bacterium]